MKIFIKKKSNKSYYQKYFESYNNAPRYEQLGCFGSRLWSWYLAYGKQNKKALWRFIVTVFFFLKKKKDVATEFPGSKFYGIDIYDIFPSNIRPPNVEFQARDALEGLPFPDNTFDLVNLRLFIISVKRNEWPIVLNEIYRILKPGGFIQCCEAGMLVRLLDEFILSFCFLATH